MLRVGQLRFAWSPPEWVVATSLCQSAGRYPLPHGVLKAGVWFRRGRLLMVSPDSRSTACPPSGRNSTYRPVQISGTGSVLRADPFQIAKVINRRDRRDIDLVETLIDTPDLVIEIEVRICP